MDQKMGSMPDCLVVVGTVAIGYLLYHAMEKPFLRKRKRPQKQSEDSKIQTQILEFSPADSGAKRKAA